MNEPIDQAINDAINKAFNEPVEQAINRRLNGSFTQGADISERSGITSGLHRYIVHEGVLVVDDSDLQRSVAVEMLRQFGISLIYEANNGVDALQMLRSGRIAPAVILLDLNMPGMDGIELIQEVATVNLQMSVIIVSGADNKLLDTLGSLVSACNMTMLGALSKPLSGPLLLRSLHRYQSANRTSPSLSTHDQPSVRDLKRAIRVGHIVPHYQPKISLKLGKVVGFEALARWRDPVKGTAPNCHFIDLAEANDLLKELTLSMLNSVLADMNAWEKIDIRPIVSLNIAVPLLEDRNFANQIIRAVRNAYISPDQILLEITESALMKDQVVALATIGRLKLHGFGFSIDDYGTGFSSMQQLSRIAFDELKIDRSFVSRATENEHMSNILQSALEMGRRLDITTVAEGVETMEQLQLLRDMGCDEIQGFLFARPMPAGDLLPWLAANAARVTSLCRGYP